MIRYGVLVALILLSGCGSMPEKVKISGCLFPNSTDMAPEWVCDSDYDGLTLAAVGASIKMAEGPSVMRATAAQAARIKLANTITLQLQQVLQDSSDLTVDAMLFAQLFDGLITAETMIGSRIYTSRSAPDGGFYLLLGFEEQALRGMLGHVIFRSMQQKVELWSISEDEDAQRALNEQLVQQFMNMLK